MRTAGGGLQLFPGKDLGAMVGGDPEIRTLDY